MTNQEKFAELVDRINHYMNCHALACQNCPYGKMDVACQCAVEQDREQLFKLLNSPDSRKMTFGILTYKP